MVTETFSLPLPACIETSPIFRKPELLRPNSIAPAVIAIAARFGGTPGFILLDAAACRSLLLGLLGALLPPLFEPSLSLSLAFGDCKLCEIILLPRPDILRPVDTPAPSTAPPIVANPTPNAPTAAPVIMPLAVCPVLLLAKLETP